MDTYIIFDLETSGLKSTSAEIIEISALRIINGVVAEEFSTLVKPSGSINPASTAVNGITDDMVRNAPVLADALSDFLNFIGDNVLLGYNISSFDLPILRRLILESLGKELNNNYIDILFMARERLSFLPNCKLSTVAAYFNICTDGAHRALADCYITQRCYEKLLAIAPSEPIAKPMAKKKNSHSHRGAFSDQTKALQTLQGFLLGIIADDILTEAEVLSLKKWLDENSYLSGNYPFDRVFAVINSALEDGILEQRELDEMLTLFKKFTSPTEECICNLCNVVLSDKVFCLTGDFSHGSRKEIESLIVRAGGVCKSSVSGKTDYVIVGDLGSPNWSCGTYGSKVKQALELQEKGRHIQIIKESELFKILEEQGGVS